MNSVASVQQPFFLTHLPTYYKIAHSDHCVLLNDVTFRKDDVYSLWHRASFNVAGSERERSLTIPVSFIDGIPVNELTIRKDILNVNDHLRVISKYYRNCRYFKDVFPIIENEYRIGYNNLMAMNIGIIKAICNYLNIDTSGIILSSKHDLGKMSRENRLHKIERITKCDVMIVDNGTRKFVNQNDFVFDFASVDFDSMFPVHFNILDILFNHSKDAIGSLLNLD